jgi:acetyltransferase-like isoleucine patch superfamily enzyme
VKELLMLISLLLPWEMRRRLLEKQFGYTLHPTSRIGLAWIFPERLIMEANTSIGDLTVCKNIALLHLHEHATIGRGNWITGFPLGPSRHFAAESDRRPELIVREHSAITHRHLIDCTNSVTIGSFTTFAGFRSQILTHTIDLAANRQSSAPVRIGDRCFVGTNSVLLGGSVLPDFCVLGAKSLLNKSHTQTHTLYGGVPAQALQELPHDLAYFQRSEGFVY